MRWRFGNIAPLAGVLCIVLSSSNGASAQDSARIDVLESEDRFAEAAELLAQEAARFPEDYALQLRLAWDLYRAERYAAALHHYSIAQELSGGTTDTRLGLAWTLLRLGRCHEAAAHWDAILERTPEHSLALEARRTCRDRVGSRGSVEIGGTSHLHQSHPFLRAAGGGFVAAEAIVEGLFVIGANYRVLGIESVTTESAPGPGPGGTRTTSSVALHHEVHGRAGFRWDDGEVVLAYGFVANDVPQLISEMHAVGAIVRLRPFGEIVLEGSGAFTESSLVLRLAPSWWLPLTEWLSLRPGGAIQGAIDDGVYGAGELTVLVHGDPGSLWLGGRVGVQYRPVFLEQPSIYNLEDSIREGVWAGGSLRLGGGLAARLDYELQRRVAPADDGSDQEAWAHFFVLRLRWESE